MEDCFETSFFKYISLLPLDRLKFFVLDASPMPEDRWEAPWVNSSPIQFKTIDELRNYLKKGFKNNMRILSLNAVYEDKTFIHYQVQIPKVKVFNRLGDFPPQKLNDAGLLGSGKWIEMYELVF